MHGSSYKLMEQFAAKYLNPDVELTIADVGSLDINGTYLPIFSKPKWKYVGIDLVPGANVNIIVPYPYNYSNIKEGTYHVVVSGQTMEHVGNPFQWMRELNRILKLNGLICVICPWLWSVHEGENYKDYWRVLPSGMRYILEENGFKVLEIYQGENDTLGIGQKVAGKTP